MPCVEAFVSVYHECSADVSLKTLLECECVPARENICGLVNFKSLSVKSGSRVAFASFHRVLTIVFGFSLAWRKNISISLDLVFCHLRADVTLVARMSLLAGALARPPVARLGQGADL